RSEGPAVRCWRPCPCPCLKYCWILRGCWGSCRTCYARPRKPPPNAVSTDRKGKIPTMARSFYHPESFPKPHVPLSQAVRKGNILQVSGQVAFDTEGNIVGDTVAEQTLQVLRNVQAVL